MNPDELILRLSASFTSVVGYGYVYKCIIEKVISGDFNEPEITLTILANDEIKFTFMSAHPSPVKFDMLCKKNQTNEPYAIMPISGFVDKNKTSWIIEDLREASS